MNVPPEEKFCFLLFAVHGKYLAFYVNIIILLKMLRMKNKKNFAVVE